MACRVCLKIAVLLFVLLMYVASWSLCEPCILWITAGSCAASVMAAPFMAPACIAGLGVSLLKGVHLGSGPLHMDIKWETSGRDSSGSSSSSSALENAGHRKK